VSKTVGFYHRSEDASRRAALRVLDFYDDHPISEVSVLAALGDRGGGPLRAEDLFEFDQDHYGGLAAVDALASRAAIGTGSRVLDVCAGLGGPARFLAWSRQCRVVALELHAGRALGAARLTRRVGLTGRVRIVRGDAQMVPFAGASFDACISQEALMHIDDKPAVLESCRRILRPGGRVAFTDWIARPRLGDLERARLRDWMAAIGLETIPGYRVLLGRAGFVAVDAEDLTDDWLPILKSRVAAWQARRHDLTDRFGDGRYRRYAELYAFFVDLVQSGKLGGGRFSATR
jgi:ubiquinone/menaquinone biosynthesis C-methylase UbiE